MYYFMKKSIYYSFTRPYIIEYFVLQNSRGFFSKKKYKMSFSSQGPYSQNIHHYIYLFSKSITIFKKFQNVVQR